MTQTLFLALAGWLTFAILGSLAALIVFVIVKLALAEEKRVHALRKVSVELGLSWHPRGHFAVTGALRALSLYSQGTGQTIYNLIYGQSEDAEVALFDFRYKTESGEQSTTHKRTIALVRSPRLNLPEFLLQPEHFFHRLGKWFGMQDINFEEYPKFSKKYLLQGLNEVAVRAVFCPQLVEYLEKMPYAILEARGDCLAVLTSDKRIGPREFPKLLEDAFGVFALLRN